MDATLIVLSNGFRPVGADLTIHHLSFSTNDAKRAREFYDPVLAVISLRLLERDERSLHYGTGDILLSLVAPVDGCAASPGNGVHAAFAARDRAMVRAVPRQNSTVVRMPASVLVA